MVKILALAVSFAAVAMWFAIGALADISVQRAVNRDATDKALHWGSHMSTRIPDLNLLVQTGTPNEEQKRAIRQTRELGDIFRFKLFNAKGQLVLISDEAFISDPEGISTEFDPEPLAVAQTGARIVEVFDGTDAPDRPDLYAEAYVPLFDEEGQVVGVAEVYVDETLTRQYFTESFENFGLFVSALSALLFLVPAAAYGLQRRLTAQSRSEADYLAKFDALTGLLNRAEFTRRAKHLMDEGKLSALLFLDADKFKAINDTHGHAVGDKFLEHVGRTLTSSTDARDLIARFGGDEFVVGMVGVRRETVNRRVRMILKKCSERIEISERSLKSSVSIGVSYLDDTTDLESALAQADAALYFAKSTGRNRYALYGDDMGEQIKRRNQLEDRVREAAENNEFDIEYQPLVDGKTRETVGYEALLRLRMKDGTPVPPADFIPLAEENGMIDRIGQWAIERAIKEIGALPGEKLLAINLSAAQFRSGHLPDIVANALLEYSFPATRLELEITESLLLEDDASVAFQIDTLQELGVSIAMDDFGTGFSSLGYLWQYGFDKIKIDRSFIAGLSENSARSREIIETVVMLGQRLGMEVTAEGVETQEQSDLLSALGCDVLQGFLFGRPSRVPGMDGAPPATGTAD